MKEIMSQYGKTILTAVVTGLLVVLLAGVSYKSAKGLYSSVFLRSVEMEEEGELSAAKDVGISDYRAGKLALCPVEDGDALKVDEMYKLEELFLVKDEGGQSVDSELYLVDVWQDGEKVEVSEEVQDGTISFPEAGYYEVRLKVYSDYDFSANVMLEVI